MVKDRSDMLSKEGTARVSYYRMTNMVHCYTLEANYNMAIQFNQINKYKGVNIQRKENSIHQII